MANIKDVKLAINNGIREILDVGFAIERSNSAIIKENIVNSYASFPFEDDSNEFKIKLLDKIKEDIQTKFPIGNKDGQSLIISLLSLYNENKDRRDHIISIEIENHEIVGYFINTVFLEEELHMSRLFTDKLKSFPNLSESLNTLILMFLNRTDQYYKQRYSKDNYEEYSVYKKIEMLKDITNTIYGSISYSIDEQYYLFFTDDLNIKSSMYNYYKDEDNINYINSFLYNIYSSNVDGKKIELGNAILNFKDSSLISESQKYALQDIEKQISIIIGQGGSGKTHLASNIIEKYLYIKALGTLSKTKVNTLYTTYSKYSLEQFLLYSKDFKNLIYVNNKEHIQAKIASLNKQIDMDRYNNVLNKLSNQNIDAVFAKYNEQDRIDNLITKIYPDVLDSLNYSKIIKYLKYINENYEEYNIIDKILLALNIKKDSPIHIPNNLVKPLVNNEINVPEKLKNDDIPRTIANIKKRDLVKQKKLVKQFSSIDLSPNLIPPLSFEELDIPLEDIIYFLTHQPIVDNPDLKSDYISALQGLLNKEDMNIELVEDLFPVFSGLITDITQFNMQFRQTIVDESVLVPGYFFPLIINKGKNIIAMGDINQLSLNQNFYPNVSTIVDKIYGKKTSFKLSIDDSYNQQSFFGHINKLSNRDDMFLLTDNFRCNKEIYRLSKEITKGIDGYDSFLGKYIEKHNIEANKDNLTKHFSDDGDIYHYGEEKFTTPFVFVDSNDKNKYENILSLIGQNRINRNDIMVITPFKAQINIIKQQIGDNILVDIIENVQGIEKKVIIFDWDVKNVNNDSFKYLDIKKFNLILLRAKNLFITLGDKNFLFNDQIENIEGNGYTIVNKFIRNSNIDIYDLV